MRRQLEQIIAQVRLMREQGCTHVFVEPSTLEKLRSLAEARRGQGASAEAAGAAAVSAGEREQTPVAARESLGARPMGAAKEALRGRPGAIDPTIPPPPAVELPAGDKRAQWEWLKKRVLECPVCNGHVHRGRKVVFGTGDLDADIFFCGEAPGMEESVQGEPFVGPAGQLLTKMIQAMGLARSQVYIGNIMNWRPQLPTEVGNREPTEQEMAFCLPYLKAQVAIVRPKVIVALGRTAVNGLLSPDRPLKMGEVRGKWFAFEGIALMPTYHPSYLLRNQLLGERRKVWEDLLHVMQRVNLPISDKQRGYFLKK